MTIHIIDFVSVGITSINFIFPMDKLNRMLFPEDDDSNINHDDYKKARF